MGLGVALILGALAGMFFTPKEGKLAELAERDVAAAGGGDVVWSAEYEALRKRVATVGGATSALVLVTVYLMSTH